jgi:hypothetical protein
MSVNDKPWEHEPDQLMFMSDAGYICEIKRHKPWGHLCGYIFIPFGHPDFGKTYNDLKDEAYGIEPRVHGGWTYSDTKGDEDGGKYTVFGFDCNHLDDYAPGMGASVPSYTFNTPSNYKTIEYVTDQLEQAAKQFKERATP